MYSECARKKSRAANISTNWNKNGDPVPITALAHFFSSRLHWSTHFFDFYSWRYTDRITKYAKLVLALLFFSAGGAQTVLSLACDQVIPLNKAVFFTSGITSTVLLGATVPLTMELAAECTYPVAEGITSGVMVLCVWIINMMFFIAFMFPQANPSFMNWLLVSSTFSCVPLVALYTGKYKRLDVDLKESWLTETGSR